MSNELSITFVSTIAWDNSRDPYTWRGENKTRCMFDRGFTGHEHLFGFGLINMNGRMYDPVMSSFLSPDNYVQSPDYSQSFNRYSYCWNNPLKYTDPSGEIAVVDDIIIAALIGGTINTIVQGCMGNINSGGDFALAFGVGALSGAVGAWAGGAAFSAVAVGGFQGGFAAGMAGGAAGGFVGSAGNAWCNGASFGDGLIAGWYGAFTGALIGGVTGGLSRGIAARNRGFDFWDGHGTPSYFLVDEMPEAYSENTGFDKSRWDHFSTTRKNYNGRLNDAASGEAGYNGFQPKEINVRLYADPENVPGVSVNTNGYYDTPLGEAYGCTVPYAGQGSKVYISPSVIDNMGVDCHYFRVVLGHEYTHAFHYYMGWHDIVKYSGESESAAMSFTEKYCNYYNVSMGKKGGLINPYYFDCFNVPKKYLFSIYNIP